MSASNNHRPVSTLLDHESIINNSNSTEDKPEYHVNNCSVTLILYRDNSTSVIVTENENKEAKHNNINHRDTNIKSPLINDIQTCAAATEVEYNASHNFKPDENESINISVENYPDSPPSRSDVLQATSTIYQSLSRTRSIDSSPDNNHMTDMNEIPITNGSYTQKSEEIKEYKIRLSKLFNQFLTSWIEILYNSEQFLFDIRAYYYKIDCDSLKDNGLLVNISTIDLSLNDDYTKYTTLLGNHGSIIRDYHQQLMNFSISIAADDIIYQLTFNTITDKFELLLAQYFSLIANYYFIFAAFYSNNKRDNYKAYSKYVKYTLLISEFRRSIINILSTDKLKINFRDTPTMCNIGKYDQDIHSNQFIPFTYCHPALDPKFLYYLYQKEKNDLKGGQLQSLYKDIVNINERYLPALNLPPYTPHTSKYTAL